MENEVNEGGANQIRDYPNVKVYVPDIVDPAEANICDGCE